MKKNSLRSWLKILLAGVVIPTLLSSSCGRAPVEYLDETPSTVNVTGAFADWTPGTSSFAGGRLMLLDASTNEVYLSSKELTESDPSFTIENVPLAGKYYGILVDSRFEPRAYFGKKMPDGKEQRVFKLSNTLGKLGTIVVRDQIMAPSQQADLEFQSNIGVKNVNKIFEKEFTTTFSANPDIDEDGIPNIIDTDVDGDRSGTEESNIKFNIFDAFTYKNKDAKVQDSTIASAYNYAYGIPKMGFFKCNFLRTPAPASMTSWDETKAVYLTKFLCSLKLPSGLVESVQLTTVKTLLNTSSKDSPPFDWKMRDDGNSGDLIASDGNWSAQFTLKEGEPETFKEQLIFATAKLTNGARKTFVTTLEPKNILKSSELTRICPLNTTSLAGLQVSLTLEPGKAADLKEFNVTLALRDENGNPKTEDKSGNKLPTLPMNLKTNTNNTFLIAETPFTLASGTYYPFVKITAPSALPGVLGSAFEYYIPTMEIILNEGDEAMEVKCTPPT
jgi:hypothetical protein